ncbi:hypothetical protein RA210_U10309 [Rubrivivax sp. A210]|nr:hypothetical protein RA210_U10309 [Rubrivivax sp. A210]
MRLRAALARGARGWLRPAGRARKHARAGLGVRPARLAARPRRGAGAAGIESRPPRRDG